MTPFMAEKTRQTRCFSHSAATTARTLRIRSALPMELPPNFITFMIAQPSSDMVINDRHWQSKTGTQSMMKWIRCAT